MSNRKEFRKFVDNELNGLFQNARKKDELSFLFAVLGIDSGEETAGWQPIGETQSLVQDLVGLVNGPIYNETKIRILLLLYCHVTEANFIYHCLFNLLLTIDGQPPRIFNFLDKYKGGIPPSVPTKLTEINSKAKKLGFPGVVKIYNEIVRADIRNAFFHSDYIIFDNELRLKHRGSQYRSISFSEVVLLVEKTLDFFSLFMGKLMEARKSFGSGYKITGRTAADGRKLCSTEVLVDEHGVAIGFQAEDPLPLW